MKSELEQQADAILAEASKDELKLLSEDALDQRGNVQLTDEVVILYECPGCMFPHNSEQQAMNCCPPQQVYQCPNCFDILRTLQDAIDHCR